MIILDLCAGTGSWSEPYRDAGYEVIQIDLPQDVRLLRFQELPSKVHGILAAPPCTVFSYARNRYPPTEDEFKEALSIVDACIRIVTLLNPEWWALENPRNKLRRFLGEPQFMFYHWEFGDPASKPTGLWGNFTFPKKSPGARTKPSTYKTNKPNAEPKDAITPVNFAKAFFMANP